MKTARIINRIKEEDGIGLKEKTDKELFERLLEEGLPSLAKLLKMTI